MPRRHDPATPAPPPPAGLRAAGWGWRHAGRSSWAVRGLDLVIEPGERVLLLGASGAGKSTLVQAFAGVLGGADEGEEEGTLEVAGLDPRHTRGRAGLVMQDPDSQIVLARVGDDVAFGCENLGVPRPEIWQRVGRALGDVGLDLSLDHPTSDLSGGQKQRVALAGVVAMQPGVLLLDEPTANLDPEGVVEVRDAVAAVVRESAATFVVIEHRVDIWLDVVDRVVVLVPGGGVLADGDPATVLGEQGDELARSGVWVPGRDPLGGRPARPTHAPRPHHGMAEPVAGADRRIRGTAERADARGDESGSSQSTRAVRAALGAETASPAADQRGGVLLTARGLDVARVEGTTVARGIGLELRAGQATAVTGPNGAGKTTLALTLAGLIPPAGGVLEASAELAAGIRPSGRRRRGASSPDTSPMAWRSRELLTRIGMVFQDPEHQFVTGSVRAELEISLKALKLSAEEIEERIAEVAGRLRLDGLLSANPYTLSGGEKRRLSVASALVARPRILVLDEPTFGQDSRTWAELVRLLAEQLARGTAVVAVTHDRAFVDALADQEIVVGAELPATTEPAGAVRP
ncbi:ABC transporter ATP-binding protein [Herbiconiux ginsengi]|uniref:Energy-coupling factor transport system ATP-binding protein n=1 Tax=Herbiconiux ginsengi TaxID=381665 RepID=A0A1H3RU75_9MICO|nr:ABC transporter ATP-binding protein [Herbiconiux ginsengi]SDZ29237.1 energy-coupling factor transport system ATP-binding protein [Herbiconiux ginsengi]